MSSHFLPTLPIHPELSDRDAAAFDDNDVLCVRLCRLTDEEGSVEGTAADDDGRDSASLDRRRKLEFGDRGEFSWIASARTSGLSSETGEGYELPYLSSTGSSSESEDSSDEAEDCDSRWLGVEADEVAVVETELMLWFAACMLAAAFFFIAAAEARVARDTVAMPDIGRAGGENAGGDEGSKAERSRPAARRRTPSLIAVLAVGMIEEAGNEDEALLMFGERLEVRGDEYARSIPRLTIRSHLRFSSASSDSCTASCERSSRHLDSFCAMN